MAEIGLQYLKSGNLNKIVFVLFIFAIFYSVSLFVAPLTLEPAPWRN